MLWSPAIPSDVDLGISLRPSPRTDSPSALSRVHALIALRDVFIGNSLFPFWNFCVAGMQTKKTTILGQANNASSESYCDSSSPLLLGDAPCAILDP